MELPRKVIKRDGSEVDFDTERIRNAIRRAMIARSALDDILLDKIMNRVLKQLSEEFGRDKKPHVERIQDIIEKTLVEFNLYDVAKAYVLYRKERERIREEKKKILGKDRIDEVDKAFSVNSIRLLAARYLLRDKDGRVIESPKELFQRIASLIVISDILHDRRVFDRSGRQQKRKVSEFEPEEYENKLGLVRRNGDYEVKWNRYHLERMKELYDELNEKRQMRCTLAKLIRMIQIGKFDNYYENYREYYELMVSKKFMPNSPTLFNAGTKLGQLSACFVLPIEDSIESIMRSAMEAAIIFKSGGGIGINYSPLRPEGDIVSTTGGTASGPVSFMRIIDTVTDVVKQGGKRRGANMGVLEITHPDIEKFVASKYESGMFENFNISVLINKEFWEHYEKGKAFPLINPRDGSVWRTLDPREIFDEIAKMAWKTADPGVLFMDNINKYNPLKEHLGEIRCVNPCGEEPMYPYESCNLGSLNLAAFINRDERGPSFDWDSFKKAIIVATRFLDNVIDLNKFPIKEIERVSKATRRIGLGFMGLADALYALGIPYNSEEGFDFMSKVAEFLAYHSIMESIELSKERGPFPLFMNSSYKDGNLPFEGYYRREWWRLDWDNVAHNIRKYGIRNSHTTTIAPTGSISMLVDVSSGLEPQFAIVFEKHVTVGKFYYVDTEFERELVKRGLYNDELLRKISENGGSVQGIEEIPNDIKRIFLVAYDIPWWDHVRAQYEVQKWISAAVSKTINMPSWVSVEDVKKAYLFAYRLGLRGITVYRDTSKGEQVLKTPTQRERRYFGPINNKTIAMMKDLGIEPPVISEEVIISRPSKSAVPSAGINKCPVCGGLNLAFQEACLRCLDCSWSTCVIG